MKQCNRKRSDMTPCVITDGPVAYAFRNDEDTRPICVGCGFRPEATGVPAPPDWDEQTRKYLRAQRKRR